MSLACWSIYGETPGVLGARLTGAGFGGCTVNLVRSNSIEEFERNVVVPYREKTGLAAEMFVCRATGGLEVIDVWKRHTATATTDRFWITACSAWPST